MACKIKGEIRLKFIFLLQRKDNIVRKMKQNHTKHVYFSFFNPLKVTDVLEIESLRKFMQANSPWGETGINPLFKHVKKSAMITISFYPLLRMPL